MTTDPDKIRKAVLDAGCYLEGHFVFADGEHSLNKLEMDKLWESQENLKIVLKALEKAEGLPEADVILGVPRGGQKLAEVLAERLRIPQAKLERIPGAGKRDFRFVSGEDKELALSSKSVRIYEDIVSTFGSVAAVVKLLDPGEQDVHSLAIWRRGKVKDSYKRGVTAHYLVEDEIVDEIYSPKTCPVCN